MFDEILKSTASRISVIAAPGSGKTKRVLLPKSQQVLADQEIDPKSVLFLTFSRLSAKDLKDRVGSMERTPRVSTVHSMCLAFLLSENSHGMRKRVESIVLDFEKEALLWDIKLIFPEQDKRDLEKMLNEFSAGWAVQPHDKVFEEDEQKRRFKAAVINWLNEHEAATMEEIVYGAVELAKQLGQTDFIRSPQHIFIDEYQDLNLLEQEFIEILATESKLLLAVGDPDQSIYSFKYAHPSGIKSFAKSAESYSSLKTGRCPKKIVEIANQLLVQADPGRTDLLESIQENDGEVHFIQKTTQEKEFSHALKSIAERLKGGAAPSDVIILVPKKALGSDFTEYANLHKKEVDISEEINFKFDSKINLTAIQHERILLLGLIIKPDSLLHIRGYLGLGDMRTNAREIKLLKDKYGNLVNVLKVATPDDFPSRQTRIRKLCNRVIELRSFLDSHKNAEDINLILEELFPTEQDDTKAIRTILEELKEEEDTLSSLYSKLIDYMRGIPTSPQDVRVMTLMGSKGLEADHVYILGCNDGNIPGSNRSSHLSDIEHKEEQRRLLFVGVTRAKKSLTISWARYIPLSQSRQQHTRGLNAVRVPGHPTQMTLGISEFLQGLNGITWEN